MGGLLPVVKGTEKGLSQYKRYERFISSKKYKLKYINPLDIYVPIHFNFYTLKDGTGGYLSAILNGYISALPSITKITGANNFLTFYKKEVSGAYEYIITTGSNGEGMLEINGYSNNLSISETEESLDGWDKMDVNEL